MKTGAVPLIAAIIAGLTAPVVVHASEATDVSPDAGVYGANKRAHFNYQMFCQGCHGPDGGSSRGVPQIRDAIGLFLGSQQGREYLVRVPGAANAPIDDAQLAELMNWTIEVFAGSSTPKQWQAYSEAEVSEYRKQPLLEVLRYRQQLLSTLAAANKP